MAEPLCIGVSRRLYIMCFRLTLSETDGIRRESYKQQQVVHFLVERSPSQKLILGSCRGAMTKHQQPLFNTGTDPQHATVCTTDYITPKEENSDADQREVPAMIQDISKPVRVNFRASSLMSSPREISHWVQRRE